MQKRKILLPLFLFPVVTLSLILLLHESLHTTTTQKVLAAKTKMQYLATTTTAPTSVTMSPSPTLVITATPTTTPTPIKITLISKKNILPIPEKITSNPNLSPVDYILAKINDYRTSKGLSKVSSNTETCNFAKTRAEEISHSFTHDGFNKRVRDDNLPYPSYQDVTENIAYNTDYTNVVTTWIASPGHEENIRKNTLFICIGKSGDYYAYEGWRP